MFVFAGIQVKQYPFRIVPMRFVSVVLRQARPMPYGFIAFRFQKSGISLLTQGQGEKLHLAYPSLKKFL